jgi:predicted nucleic acid-binding Zn ribbon protein
MIAVQRVLPDMLAAIVRRQPMSPAKVDFAWRTSVGPAIARATTVRLRDDGALVVRLTDARWKAELNRGRTLLRERLGLLLGDDLQRIVIHTPGDQQ